jgi:hypothetical protein
MAAMSPTELYRVVGVRSDGSRMLICVRVTRKQAIRVKETLDGNGVFKAIEIESDDQSAPELDLISDH